MTVRILTGDCRAVLKTLPDESVNCVVTSPPYWGLRDYGTGKDGIGLEPSLREHVDAMAAVFDDVRRVLRADGTLWLNYGDAYAGGNGYSPNAPSNLRGSKQSSNRGSTARADKGLRDGFKPKDLMGLPWRIAFALQKRGWWLRQDIIWSKPNPMPESVTDRCTKAHEYIFLLSKSERYYFDQAAIAESQADSSVARLAQDVDAQEGSHRAHAGGKTNGTMKAVGAKGNAKTFRGGSYVNGEPGPRTVVGNTPPAEGATRNKRSVWTVGTAPFKDAHFATFPPALIEPCILAGCPKGGTVLDPFGGAGTTGLVADRLGRDAILIELNPAYAEMARKRIHADAPLLSQVAAE